MSRNSLLVLVAVMALVLLVGQAEATTISGSAETCPGGDPLVPNQASLTHFQARCHLSLL